MEENKNCCENKGCDKKEDCCHLNRCCMKKCHLVGILIGIVLLVLVFCLGAQYSQLKSETRGGRYIERGEMMDWGYKNVKPLKNIIDNTEQVPTAPELVQ